MKSIFHRTSVRDFKKVPVEREKVIEILKAAMASPSAGNQQPWEFYVVQNRSVIEKLAAASPYSGCAAASPLVFVICSRTGAGLRWPQWAPQDLSAATENLLLEIDDQGLGGVWMGIYPDAKRMENVKTALNLPDDLEPFAIVPCGYPAAQKQQENRWDESRVHYIEDEENKS